jgi:conjugal transfer pilus assembly protein TraK
MKTSTPIFLLSLAAIGAGTADAQQSASATFGNPPPTMVVSGSAEFPSARPANVRCQRIASIPCAPKRPKKATATLKTQATHKFDRLAVHPEAAIKETKTPEIDLPGVMKIAGADPHALDFSRARILDIVNGGSQTVYVSKVDQNRFQLPWPNSKVVGTEELNIDKRANSNNVYVQFKEGVTRGVQVYFEQPDGPSVLGVKLIPKEIDGQTFLVRDSTLRVGEAKPVKGNDYVGSIQALMEQVALGGAPQGFSQTDLAVGPIAMNGLVINPKKRFSSADKDIYVYDVVNPGPQKASLQEREFDGENVLAISIFPKPVLAANERAMIIVVTRKAPGG